MDKLLKWVKINEVKSFLAVYFVLFIGLGILTVTYTAAWPVIILIVLTLGAIVYWVLRVIAGYRNK